MKLEYKNLWKEKLLSSFVLFSTNRMNTTIILLYKTQCTFLFFRCYVSVIHYMFLFPASIRIMYYSGVFNFFFCILSSKYYRELGIEVALTYLEFWNLQNHFHVDGNHRALLSQFLHFKTEHLPRDSFDAAFLVT